MGQWIVGVTSFQKIFGLCGLKCHIMEIWTDVTLDDTRTTDNGRTECEDRARILETEFAILETESEKVRKKETRRCPICAILFVQPYKYRSFRNHVKLCKRKIKK